MSTNSKICQL